ncbi:hypothetical protein H0Z60_14625 [Ectothiorhodospiraceae bacterium WFHF3C12]|nr:hypothetical protein [Ectothiorhodospiraceae bacterium WFHF3C12]
MSRANPAERMSRFRRRKRAGYRVVVSEGDSWFDYPMYLNLIDRIDDEGYFAHLRLESSGATVADMIGTKRDLNALADIVAEEQPICVLFSGGGNDLLAKAGRLFRKGQFNDPSAHLREAEVDKMTQELDRHYRRMLDRIGPMAPVLAHGYDYFQPSARPVKFIGVRLPVGPWMHPAMLDKGIVEDAAQRSIATVLVDRMNEILQQIQVDYPLDFVHVDLRGTLNVDSDWANEIHPNNQGFRKVAYEFIAQMKAKLPKMETQRREREFQDA